MKNANIRIIAADDHEVYLDGLELLFNQHERLQLLARAANGEELIELANEQQADVIVVDLRLPDMTGIEAVNQLKKLPDPPACIIVSMFGEEHLVIEAAEAGVLGYVTKGARKEELVEAIYSVFQNKPYYCKNTSSRLLTYFFAKNGKLSGNVVPYLNDEEREIIRLVCEGLTSKQIGEKLFKGSRWVELARAKIAEKLGARTSFDWIKTAVKLGIYHIN